MKSICLVQFDLVLTLVLVLVLVAGSTVQLSQCEYKVLHIVVVFRGKCSKIHMCNIYMNSKINISIMDSMCFIRSVSVSVYVAISILRSIYLSHFNFLFCFVRFDLLLALPFFFAFHLECLRSSHLH